MSSCCSRGILQWNDPYVHLVNELTSFGIYLRDGHMNYLRLLLKQRGRITVQATSHRRYAAKHESKYHYECDNDEDIESDE